MKKRILALLLVFACVLVTACGGKAPENNQGAGSGAPSEQPDQSQTPPADEQGQDGKDQGQSQQGQSQQPTIPERIVEIRFEYEDESLEDDADEMFFYSTFAKPVVTIKGNDAAAAKINKFFEGEEEAFEDMVEYYEPDAKDYYDTTEGQSYYMCCRDVFTDRADAGVISIVQTESSYFGGAHGGYYIVPYNFDTSTGDLLELKDLSDDGDKFRQMIKEAVIEQAKEYPDQDAFYNPPGSEEFASAVDDVLTYENWYFTKAGLVVVANEYSIGPYAAGRFTFEIPYDSLDGLKEQYVYNGAFVKSIPYEKDFSIDLNGDGTQDKIHTTTGKDDYYMINEVVFDINDGDANVKIDNNYTGEDKAYLENPMESYYVVDLDKTDSFLEIAVCDYGMNDYNTTFFFRYDGGKLHYLGYVPNVLDDMRVELFGNGVISGTLRMEMIETVHTDVFYQLKDGKMCLVEQEWYEPDYSDFMEDYIEHDVRQDVVVYTDNSLQSEKVVLHQGEEDVRFLATDNVEWVKLQTEDGQVYYLHMAQPLIIDSDGKEMYATDVFEDILLAG